MPYVSIDNAKKIIKNGDVLLFKGSGMVARLIKWGGAGIYSHVAIAYLLENRLFCLEFREGYGGRIFPLEKYFGQGKYWEIDVFRPHPYIVRYKVVEEKIEKEIIKFDAQCIINKMYELIGLPYGWTRIGIMILRKLPFLRWMFSIPTDDRLDNGHTYPVCSTAIAKAFRECYVDLMPFKSDLFMEPSDISRSAVLSYLFSIRGNK